MVEEPADGVVSGDDKVSTSLGRFGRSLATLVSIICFIGLWAAGVVAGALLPVFVGGAALVVYGIRWKLRAQKGPTVFDDVTLPVAVGGLLLMLNDALGVRFDPFPLLPDFLAIIGGGVAFGVRRRVFFVRAFEYPREAADLDLLARMLATSASIACYTGLWVIAAAAGYFLSGTVANGAVALGMYFGLVKLKDGRLRTLVNATWPPVAFGSLTGFLSSLEAGPDAFPALWLVLSSIGGIVGGVTLGVIRRQFFFARVFSKTVVKVVAVPLVVVSAVFIAGSGVWSFAEGMLIPVELVTPSAVAEGWTATTPVDFAGKRARFLKGSATIDIVANLLGEEEVLQAYELNSASVRIPLTLAGPGSTSQIGHSDIIMPNGRCQETGSGNADGRCSGR